MKQTLLFVTLCCIFFCICACDDGPTGPMKIIPEEKPENVRPPLNQQDSLAMIAIYKKNGPWGNEWDLKDIKTWSGVTASLETTTNEYRITEFNFNGFGFHGSIPAEFKEIPYLRVLGLGGGDLGGEIPAWIGDLKNLEVLYIGYNNVYGSIPPEIGKLTKLTRLTLGANHLSGELPKELGNLVNLERLTIMQTDITGEVPSTLINLKKAKDIILEKNKLSGRFPLELVKSQANLLCNHNNITELPFEAWRDEAGEKMPQLQGNRLSGTIPDWVKETPKWKEQKGISVGNQQSGYGYTNFDN